LTEKLEAGEEPEFFDFFGDQPHETKEAKDNLSCKYERNDESPATVKL